MWRTLALALRVPGCREPDKWLRGRCIVGSSEKSTFSRCEICSGLQADDQQRLCRCNSYDNAQARTIIGLFKTEVINRLGPWKSKDQVEWEPCNRSIGSTRSARSNLSSPTRNSPN